MIPKSEIVQAAKDACIHDDIIRLNGGYDAQVSEGGVNFSGGQRQRILIVRTLAAKPAIVILDEAISTLGNSTQAIVNESLDRLNTTQIVHSLAGTPFSEIWFEVPLLVAPRFKYGNYGFGLAIDINEGKTKNHTILTAEEKFFPLVDFIWVEIDYEHLTSICAFRSNS